MDNHSQYYIDPDRGQGDSLLVYSEHEGDAFKTLVNFVDEQGYLDILRRRYFDVRFGDGITRIYPAYLAFTRILHGHDFQIDRLNERNGATHDTQRT